MGTHTFRCSNATSIKLEIVISFEHLIIKTKTVDLDFGAKVNAELTK